MTPEQALNLLAQCAAVHTGTLQDHQNLQTALQLLGGVVAPKSEPVAEPVAPSEPVAEVVE